MKIARDARAIQSILERFPPGLARVLEARPLVARQPELPGVLSVDGRFVGQHPEILRNPAYFLQHVSVSGEYVERTIDPAQQVVRMWENTIESIFFFAGFMIALTTLAWLLKTAIDYRRWSRLTKIQTEVHTKLLDRFSNNDELITYIQTPSGRRFLDSAPIPLDAGPRSLSAPFGRILWSVQVGLVVGVGGLGMLFVSGRVPLEVHRSSTPSGSSACRSGSASSCRRRVLRPVAAPGPLRGPRDPGGRRPDELVGRPNGEQREPNRLTHA